LNDTYIVAVGVALGVGVAVVAVVISFSAILAVPTNCVRPVAAAFVYMCCMIIKMFAKWRAQHSYNEWRPFGV